MNDFLLVSIALVVAIGVPRALARWTNVTGGWLLVAGVALFFGVGQGLSTAFPQYETVYVPVQSGVVRDAHADCVHDLQYGDGVSFYEAEYECTEREERQEYESDYYELEPY